MSNGDLPEYEKALFRAAMKTVKPLDKSKKVSNRTSPPSEKKATNELTLKPPIKDYNLSNYYTELVHSESILSYCKQSIPRKRLTQLKSGQISWQARLDLHGLRPDAARESLCGFIDQQFDLGHRCLLIIHGKGGLRGEAPVLKNHVNHWLRQLSKVLAFHSAMARDGGSGALYVLLQRQRGDS